MEEEREEEDEPMTQAEQGSAEKKQMIGQYAMGRILGAGAFCKVRLATKLNTDALFAVKIVNKDSIRDIRDLERVMREMHVLKNISHPNIISMHESIEKGSRLYLVLDFASAGELHAYCVAKGALPEKLARVFMSQILSGVDFIHRQGISHRDLKPENVLLVGAPGALAGDPKSEAVVCKIADFGLSNDMTPGEMLKTICGTPAYAAPEITLGQKYDGVLVDLWSLGCILAFMLSARQPFRADSQPELFQKIQTATFLVPQFSSPEASDLVHKLIEVNPGRRIAITLCWQHAWLASSRFDFSSEIDDDFLEKELLSISMEEGEEEKNEASTRFDGASEIVDEEAVQTLELLPSGVALAALAHAAYRRVGEVQELQVNLSVEHGPPGASSAPAVRSPAAAGSAGHSGGQMTEIRLFWNAKDASAEGRGLSKNSALNGPPLALRQVSSSISTAGAGGPPSLARGRGIRRASLPTQRPAALFATSSTSSSSSSPSSCSSAAVAQIQSAKIASDISNASSSSVATSLGSAGSPSPTGSSASDRKAGKNLATVVTTKEPKVVLKHLQRIFSDYKVGGAQQAGWSLEGQKNRVRFEISLSRIVEVGQKEKVGDNLYLVTAKRMTGDVASFRDIARRLLLKL